MDDQSRGFYQKYRVERLDDPEGKHSDCPFFVLDLKHDIHARAAMQAYIDSCRVSFPYLAADLEAYVQLWQGRTAKETPVMTGIITMLSPE